MMRRIMFAGPRLEGALYVLLLAKANGPKATAGLVLLGIPVLMRHGLNGDAS